MTELELGQYGENIAEKHLIALGYKIKARNIRYGKEELDIVAEKDSKLIVVEVKTRQTAEIGEPWRAVTRKKQRHIIRCAHNYIVDRNIDLEVRFDIVSIVHNSFRTDLEHIVDAFST